MENIMKSILKSLLFAGFIGISAIANAENPALMTLRFYNQTIDYQDQLFFAVREAVKAKPSVVFEVVSYGSYHSNGSRIAEEIKQIGVNPAQVTFRSERGANFEEVKIFVR